MTNIKARLQDAEIGLTRRHHSAHKAGEMERASAYLMLAGLMPEAVHRIEELEGAVADLLRCIDLEDPWDAKHAEAMNEAVRRAREVIDEGT